MLNYLLAYNTPAYAAEREIFPHNVLFSREDLARKQGNHLSEQNTTSGGKMR